ncbi:hypothetical protein HDC93_000901 [Streptomyces sp. AK010]|nr:hypothetical protein [Streptomyces sp. AK010]
MRSRPVLRGTGLWGPGSVTRRFTRSPISRSPGDAEWTGRGALGAPRARRHRAALRRWRTPAAGHDGRTRRRPRPPARPAVDGRAAGLGPRGGPDLGPALGPRPAADPGRAGPDLAVAARAVEHAAAARVGRVPLGSAPPGGHPVPGPLRHPRAPRPVRHGPAARGRRRVRPVRHPRCGPAASGGLRQRARAAAALRRRIRTPCRGRPGAGWLRIRVSAGAGRRCLRRRRRERPAAAGCRCVRGW